MLEEAVIIQKANILLWTMDFTTNEHFEETIILRRKTNNIFSSNNQFVFYF